MSQSCISDLAALGIHVKDNVVRTAELRAAGLSGSAISARCRAYGAWQRLLPGVILLHNQPPQRKELVRAAVAYAGDGAVLTGIDSAFPTADADYEIGPVHVLVPAHRRVAGQRQVLIERTTRLPDVIIHNGLPCAPAARAVLDTVRREQNVSRMKWILTEAVRRGTCTVMELQQELNEGSQRGSAAPRSFLRTINEETRSNARMLAQKIVRTSPLPEPRWQPTYDKASGTPFGIVDAWWDEIGFAWQVINRISPSNAKSQRGLIAGLNALIINGIVLLRTDKTRLSKDPHGVRRELINAFHYAATRKSLAVGCRP